MKNKFLISIIIIYMFATPAFADAGIPTELVLCLSNPASFFAIGFSWPEVFIIFTLLTFFFFVIVSLIETLVIKSILKISDFNKAFGITLKANAISTITGAIITIILIKLSLLRDTPLFLILLHIIMLILSYFIEYYVAKKDLADFKVNDVRKSFLFANMLSYVVFPFLIIGFVLLVDYDSQRENRLYEKINYSSIDNIEVVRPAFIPKPVNRMECFKIRKKLGINAICNKDTDYWTGAVKACGGVEHLYSENQIKKIIIKLYNVDTTNYNVTGDFFHKEIAERYGLPVDFLPPELLKKHDEISETEYKKFATHFPMHAYIWSNEAYDTAHPYVGKLYSRTGSFQSSGGYDLDESSKTYAICINNKNIED